MCLEDWVAISAILAVVIALAALGGRGPDEPSTDRWEDPR